MVKEALVLGFMLFAVFQLTAGAVPANTYAGDGFSFSYPDGWSPESGTAFLKSSDSPAFVEAGVIPEQSMQVLAIAEFENPGRFQQEALSFSGRSWTKTCLETAGARICRAFTKCGDSTIAVTLNEKKEIAGSHDSDYAAMLGTFGCL